MLNKIIAGFPILLIGALLALSIMALVYTSRMADACVAKGGVWLAREQVCVKSDYILPIK